MVGQPAVGQSPEPMVSRSVGGRNLDTMVTQSGRTVGPLGSQSVGGRRADPMVPVAGNPIISRQLSSPLNTAFRKGLQILYLDFVFECGGAGESNLS